MQDGELIWYGAYGSNLNEERFHCYIRGGRPNGAAREYPGCTDPTLPRESQAFYIPSELYFAKSSATWENSGVAFISNDLNNTKRTWGRMYLITQQQFIEVVKQENSGKEIEIDFKRAMTDNYIFKPGSWYGKIVFLGKHNDHLIFTFTNELNLACTKPGSKYLKIIVAGIKEFFPYSNLEIAEYLFSTDGIKGNYTMDELLSIASE